ncbi:MAG: [FeFe] hydrogenase H-cluster maturation GTPase HydF [Geothrix sp.]|uniref:[FeFe] hydrogenase H-cluster maturation GTPase HydF n=1 Tax=Geothrix sp. TaxID=1962974 RepID=UPI0017EBDDF1|nr:[FeFe] hydrogenase H-cluster maturation GTPase HydF [Geothrix sp.]NWJ42085.1 [FeFe] hydrogenase H-cluster maturation GTPase HydF [Geothrix sp.]WIL19947.1 MAG: [FeFe] hydrogenase H-cluster maturation GTPase HydF [Geothrix sp.]
MRPAPRNLRLHIGLFGRRNAGKSSLLNALTRQQVSIVSPQPGTTTDPVEKPMELLPLGPVLFVDTAGLDDEGTLGEARSGRSRAALDRVDLAILVAERGQWGAFEAELLADLKARSTPTVVALNKSDLRFSKTLPDLGDTPVVPVSALRGQGLDSLREALLRAAPEGHFDSRHLLADLVPPGEVAVLVMPIDSSAPKGRLILPQVMAVRDVLDGAGLALVVQARELSRALFALKRLPALVVTDSQAFQSVAMDVPDSVPMTSFSILMSRFQGDLAAQVRGTLAIEDLREGDRVLVAEGCTHHPTEEDIGRVKLPRWLNQKVGGPLQFDTVQGREFPTDLSPYKLVVHCGNCMGNRREMLSRTHRCESAGVPITNYGLAIAHSLGILHRALRPFPEVQDALHALQP